MAAPGDLIGRARQRHPLGDQVRRVGNGGRRRVPAPQPRKAGAALPAVPAQVLLDHSLAFGRPAAVPDQPVRWMRGAPDRRPAYGHPLRPVHIGPLPGEPHVHRGDMLAEAAAQSALCAVAHHALDAQDHDIKQRPAGLRADEPPVLVRLPHMAGGPGNLPAGIPYGGQLPCALCHGAW